MPTRYESVGCDDGAFRVPKEYEAFGESHDAAPVQPPDDTREFTMRQISVISVISV